MRPVTIALLGLTLLGASCSREADPDEVEPDEAAEALDLAESEAEPVLEGEGATPEPAGVPPEPIVLGAGFVPDPHIERGTAGGPRDAHAVHPACTGWTSEVPSHVLRAPVAFTSLRVLAHATDDISLVVQKPDHSYLCNDDAHGAGTDPEIEGFFPAGDYNLWVGTSREGARSPYVLGITELGRAQVNHARIARGL